MKIATMNYLKLLEYGHAMVHDGGSRLEYLADYVFDFTTYDSEIAETFAQRAVEVCRAINDGTTYQYIERRDQYEWFIVMVNIPFFADRIEWGTSVRGAWWEHGQHSLECSGLYDGDEQITKLELTRDEWMQFIAAIVEFAAVKD